MSRSSASLLLPIVAATAVACHSSPTGPGNVPTPPPGSPVSGFVFYDENANGLLDPNETVRLPGVTVVIGGHAAQSTAGGRFTVDAVPQGVQSASAQPASLPAYFKAGAPVSLSVPQTSGELAVPATLAIGPTEQPNAYMAFGDSITFGDGSSNGGGYRDPLVVDLLAYWGKVTQMYNEGQEGTKSNKGESRIASSLHSRRPAYALILYGTNDYNDAECRNTPPCYTVDALRSMIVQTREAGAFPVLGTIPPVNPAYVDRGAEDRNAWVMQMNVLVRAMATQENVALAEVYGDLMKQPNLPSLFSDDKHPNDAGYAVLAQSFLNAITRPVGASAARRPRSFSFALAGS
jgi:lysophospholipase L1-like esterase